MAEREPGILPQTYATVLPRDTTVFNYSLLTWDMIANMIEIHGNSTGLTEVCSPQAATCRPVVSDGTGKTDIPFIVVTGGVMDAGPDPLTLEQIGAYSARSAREVRLPKKSYLL